MKIKTVESNKNIRIISKRANNVDVIDIRNKDSRLFSLLFRPLNQILEHYVPDRSNGRPNTSQRANVYPDPLLHKPFDGKKHDVVASC